MTDVMKTLKKLPATAKHYTEDGWLTPLALVKGMTEVRKLGIDGKPILDALKAKSLIILSKDRRGYKVKAFACPHLPDGDLYQGGSLAEARRVFSQFNPEA